MNLLYFFKPKQNWKLPDIFNDYLLNKSIAFYSSLEVLDFFDKLLINNEIITVEDFGAGSKKGNKKDRKISDIAKYSSTNYENGIFFQKLIDHFNIKNILELGTSLGIGSLYMALASKTVQITTIEASKNILNFTKNKFKNLGIKNINFLESDFDTFFDENFLINPKFDLFYIDGNHKFNSTLKYFDYIQKYFAEKKTIIILDDINWSCGMYKAWKTIVKSQKDAFMLNLFQLGIVFRGYDLPKGEFIVTFTD